MKKYLVLVFLLLSVLKINAQCTTEEIIFTICDINNIPGSLNGIIDLKQKYFEKTNTTISGGLWEDPAGTYALNTNTGELETWKLPNATVSLTDPNKQGYYVFNWYDVTSPCGNSTPKVVMKLNLRPFSGVSNTNIMGCYEKKNQGCKLPQSFNLDLALYPSLNTPNPHLNGRWEYIGPSGYGVTIFPDAEYKKKTNFSVALPENVLSETFKFRYIVEGISSSECTNNNNSVTEIEYTIVKQVNAGEGNTIRIYEEDILNGVHDNDIDLRDDNYLVGENTDGKWGQESQIQGLSQIDNPYDSKINLKEIYQKIIADPNIGKRFENQIVSFSYEVESPGTLCENDKTKVNFVFIEQIRDFNAKNKRENYCLGDARLEKLNLYDFIDFPTYDYPKKRTNEWFFTASTSIMDKFLDKNPDWEYAPVNPLTPLAPKRVHIVNSKPIVDLSFLTTQELGEYSFEYKVPTSYNTNGDEEKTKTKIFTNLCLNETKEPNDVSRAQKAIVKINIQTNVYSGENTRNLEYCESFFSNPVNLITLLKKDDSKGEITNAGEWKNTNTNNVVTNPFTLPAFTNNATEQTFNFTYTAEGCNGSSSSTLEFTVYKLNNAGENKTIETCSTSTSINAFSELGSNATTGGSWKLPNGNIINDYNLIINPETATSGDYVYTAVSNGECTDSATLTINIIQKPNAGTDVITPKKVCKSLEQFNLLDAISSSADKNGKFFENNLEVSNIINPKNMDVGTTYTYQYRVEPQGSCAGQTTDKAILKIIIEEPPVAPTITSEIQKFCAIDKLPTIEDLNFQAAAEYDWFDDETSTEPLSLDTKLKNNEDYFIATKKGGCNSERKKVIVKFKEPNTDGCNVCVSTIVSPNGDSINDVFNLCTLPELYPNFILKIFNRYGTIIYTGTKDSEPFKGENLPSGIYFYVFNPNDSVNKPIQGNFYLGK